MKSWLTLLMAGLLASAAGLPASQPILYPDDSPRYGEYIDLLRAALDTTVASDGPYTLQSSGLVMNEARFFEEAARGRSVNVVWGATSSAREKALLPVRIPLSKGLLGYRLFLIRKADQPRFDPVRTTADLRSFSFGLGFAWGDIPIYRAAGFKVQISLYEQLFPMLAGGRFDVLSRGVNEIFDEVARIARSEPDLAIERHLVLHYPYPFYFFVSPQQPQLAARIDKGLRTLVDDGRFEKIFLSHNQSNIGQARLGERHLIELANPDLPPLTPLDDPRLWYRPAG